MTSTRLMHPVTTRSLQLGLVVCVVVGLGLIITSFLQAAVSRPDQLPSTIGQPLAATAAASFPDCRFGAGGAISSTYAISSLNLGWYMDWGTQLNPVRPNGAEYVQVVRLKPTEGGYTYTPGLPALYQAADQNPGAVWLIGNEPDTIQLQGQDNLPPEVYAQAYHDLYQWLKQRDSSARIGAGSIVQPTPLRLQYLDLVLNTYRQLYGQPMPVDIWSIHSYILREIDTSDPQACLDGNCTEPPYEIWGAFVPPGLLGTWTRGVLYTYSNMFDTSILRQRLIDFRTWLRDRGYRDVPLYITEYGTLFPYQPFTSDPYYDEFGQEITEARSITFMMQTFDILRTATDSSVGYPADGNRLVQRWLWYSFDDTKKFGGPLFNPLTGQRTALGNAWASYVQAISPTIDLLAVRAQGDTLLLPAGQTSLTGTLRAQISNIGNISTTAPLTVTFYAGQIGQAGSPIGAPQIVTRGLQGCADSMVVTTTWPSL
ncbi:MAG: hypothetical protein HY870_13740, partial [Chloroflexi bacterium]|nr:hypothetical protein [Chloroflexota bacterium]